MIISLTKYAVAESNPLSSGLNLDSAKLALLADTYTPDIDAHSVWGDVSAHEIAGTTGYSAGGAALGGTISESGGLYVFDAPDLTFSALEATFAYGVIYADVTGYPLFAYTSFSSGVSITITGYDFVIKWASAGIITSEII